MLIFCAGILLPGEYNATLMMFHAPNPLKFLLKINRFLMLASCTCVIGMIFYIFYPVDVPTTFSKLNENSKMPKELFTSLGNFQSIGNGPLSLRNNSSLTLPNLKDQFIFYGMNDRPDADKNSPSLFIGIRGNEEIAALSKQKIYFSKTMENKQIKYRLNQTDSPGSLWLELAQSTEEIEAGQEVQFKIGLDDPKIAINPVVFHLKPEIQSLRGKNWELDSVKVDSGLLSKQKARWIGLDLFLEKHGGLFFEQNRGKQRIDFGENDTLYSCFVKEGDCLVWKEGRWVWSEPNESTRGFSLLQITKIEERLIQLTLWSPEGWQKIKSTLIKVQDLTETYKNISAFNYLGAKGWNEWIFEVSGKREKVKPLDWWLKQETGWKKLSSKNEIESFVALKIRGDLLVIEKIIQKDNQPYLMGHLFNSARTKMHQIELPLKQKKNESLSAHESIESKPNPAMKERKLSPGTTGGPQQ